MARRFGYTKTNNKYGARKVVYRGIKFDSRYERDRYIYLLQQQRQGKISGLRLQQGFVLITQTIRLVPVQLKTKIRWDKKVVEQDAQYHCDFVYKENGRIICEEFKSEQTSQLPDYILRRKLMIKKIYAHNERQGRTPWVFREFVYDWNGETTVTDK